MGQSGSGHVQSDSRLGEALCLECGLCCNGVIFVDVRLREGDDGGKLARLGLPITGQVRQRFPQPCAALAGCRCRIYRERPTQCREFECLLFKKVAEGEVRFEAARRWVARARKKAERVRSLLRELGDSEEGLALSVRVRRVSRRFERESPSESQSRMFGELTLAFHDLTRILGRHFYPAPRV